MTNLSFVLEPTRTAPEQARRAIRACLSDSLPAPTIHELSVVATELVAAGVEHGSGAPIEVRITVRDDGTVRGEVEDHGNQTVAVEEVADGIGLQIVDGLSEQWAVDDERSRVWFELAAESPL